MTSRGDFYDDNRKERKVDFLANVRVIRKYFCRKNGLEAGEFEFICKLHSFKHFRMDDFNDNKHLMSWDTRKWRKMYGVWIIVHRHRKPSEGRNYKLYKLSPKGHRMIEDCYDILCGAKPIPEDVRKNPIMKEDTYNDKRYAAAIRKFNEARNNK